jgi:hypothetical protein
LLTTGYGFGVGRKSACAVRADIQSALFWQPWGLGDAADEKLGNFFVSEFLFSAQQST